MNPTKYETNFELSPKIMEIVNFYKEDLPRYSLQSNVGYIHNLYLKELNLKITYFYGHGYFYRITIQHIDENT